MRTCAMVLGLFLILMTASSIPAEQLSSVGTIDEPELDWEGAGTSTLIYEGQLSDPQDLDNITLGDDAGAVHFIQLVSSDEALKITVREDGEIHGEEVGSSVAFLLSGTGNAMWVEISNVNFTSPNSYQIHIHSNSADEDVELGDLTASGYIHESDTEGDRSYFSAGGNADIEIQWFGADMTEFVGYMTHMPTGEVVNELEFNDNSTTTMTLHTPAVDSRFENYEFTIWARTDGVTGVWSLNKTILSEGDALCPHDCPNTVDETRFHSEAVTIENERWATDGNLSGQDTVDVYPIFIQGDSWEVHRLIATIEGDDSLVQIQSWDNSGEFLTPLDVADGSGTVGLNMTPGYHLVKVSRSNSAIGTNAYHLDLLTINVTSGDAGPEGEIVDQWREFIPFYIGIGLVMLAPMGYVLWSLRGTKLADEVQAHERGRLKRLRERLARLIESDGSEHEISSALEMLEAVQWKATVAEMGEATLTHHTDSVTLKAWRMGPGSLLVGIHVEQAPWNLAALRFEAAGGPSWKITKVSPNSLYDGDEIFLDTLEVGSTRFLRLQLEGSANGLDLHLSGLVEGKPLAAIPARALLMEDE